MVHGWTLSDPKFQLFAPLFYALEVLPILVLYLRRAPGEDPPDRAEAALIVGMILLFPLYRIGVSNDFMMRASIVPLALAAVAVGERIALRAGRRPWTASAPALAMLALAAVTPSLEIARAFAHPARPPLELSLPEAWAASDYAKAGMQTYLAPAADFRRLAPLYRQPATPDRLASRAHLP